VGFTWSFSFSSLLSCKACKQREEKEREEKDLCLPTLTFGDLLTACRRFPDLPLLCFQAHEIKYAARTLGSKEER